MYQHQASALERGNGMLLFQITWQRSHCGVDVLPRLAIYSLVKAHARCGHAVKVSKRWPGASISQLSEMYASQ